MATIRSFIAINLPAPAKRSLAAASVLWSGLDSKVKLVQPNQFHLTLAFLGSVAKIELPKIAEATAKEIADLPPFSVEITGFGGFPNLHRARVVWLGVGAGEPILQQLYQRVWTALTQLGFRTAEEYHPHLTVARIKRDQDPLDITKLGSDLQTKKWLQFPVTEVSLMQSDLSRKGAIYTELLALPLSGK